MREKIGLFKILSLIFAFALLFVNSSKSSVLDDENDVSLDFREFKYALNFFSEPYMSEARIKNLNLSGEYSSYNSGNLISAIRNILANDKIVFFGNDKAELEAFFKQFTAGNVIQVKITGTTLSNILTKDRESLYTNTQNELIKAIQTNKGIVFPMALEDHSIVLIIKPAASKKCYNLTVVNTGPGSENHYNSADPNGIYPYLTRPWVEFRNVPRELIFNSENPWFVKALFSLKHNEFMKKIRSNVKPLTLEENTRTTTSIYLYGTILTNFNQYRVKHIEGKKIEVPLFQGSVSSLSSMVYSMLYCFQSKASFYRIRMIIGHSIIETLLKNMGKSEIVLRVISDGFEGAARSYLKGLTSSLAQQCLDYLEAALPDVFKGAGRIGSDKSNWLFENKGKAIQKLQKSGDILNDIINTIAIGQKIVKLLNVVPLRKDSTQIQVEKQYKKKYLDEDVSNLVYEAKDTVKTNMDDFFNFKPDRFEVESMVGKNIDGVIVDFREFAETLIGAATGNTAKLAALNDFLIEFYFSGWKEKIKEIKNYSQVSSLRKSIGIMISFMSHQIGPTHSYSADHLIMVYYLDVLNWSLFSIGNAVLEEPNVKFDLTNISAPTDIRSEIDFMFGVFHLSWNTKNIFNPRVELMYSELRAFSESSSVDCEELVGPLNFIENGELNFTLPPLTETGRVSRFYDQIMKDNHVTSEYNRHINSYDKNERDLWVSLSPETAKLAIFFVMLQPSLDAIYNNLYEFMTTSAAFASLLSKKPILLDNTNHLKYWIQIILQKPIPIYTLKLPATDGIFEAPFQVIKSTWNYSEMDTSLFFKFRHFDSLSGLFASLSSENYQAWLNFIKDAKTSVIFDFPYFQHLTDQLLNSPKLAQNEVVFPVDRVMAEDIIWSMKLMLDITLNELNQSLEKVGSVMRTKISLRASTIAILITRFIGRVELHNLLTANESAKHLADVHNSIFTYASIKTMYSLSEADVSCLHLALSRICAMPLRNSVHFLKNLNLIEELGGFKPDSSRNVLKVFHWFVAATSYTIETREDFLIDAEFKAGLQTSLIANNKFLETLLTNYFIPSILEGGLGVEKFRYRRDTLSVEITVKTEPTRLIIVDLLSGKIVIEGFLITKTNHIINSTRFQDYFSIEDRHLAMSGTALNAAGREIYSLPDYKDGSHVVIKGYFSSTENDVNVLRKWNDSWYLWVEKDGCENFLKILGYRILDNLKFYKRQIVDTDGFAIEFLIFGNGEKEPLIRTLNKNSNTSVWVRGLIDDEMGWRIIDSSVDKFISAFNYSNYFVAAKTMEGRTGVIYSDLRLAEDPSRPITMIQGKHEDGFDYFKVLNSPDLVITTDQSIFDGYSYSGTLVAESDSKKYLLIPEMERAFSLDDVKEKPVIVHKIPIIEGCPTPQSRLHKLLLAYFAILALDYKTARELLHPAASFHHNEPLKVEEIEIMNWIVKIISSAPEFIALKIMIYVHFHINITRFSMLMDNVLENVAVDKILSVSSSIDLYLQCLRDVPEKFHVHRIFPEILYNAQLQRNLFQSYGVGLFKSEPSAPQKLIAYDLLCSKKELDSKFDVANEISIKNLLSLVYDDKIDIESLKDYQYLMPKHNGTEPYDQNPAYVFYAILTSPNWRRCFEDPFENSDSPIFITFKGEGFETDFQNGPFNFVYQADINGFTRKEEIVEALKSDLTLSNVSIDGIDLDAETKNLGEFVNEKHKNVMLGLKARLESIIKNSLGEEQSEVDPVLEFNEHSLEKSKILTKLRESIETYLNEKGRNRLAHLKLSDYPDLAGTFQNLKKLLAESVKTFQDENHQAASELVEMTSYEKKKSVANVFSSLLRFMHQKKENRFSNLYACYRNNSLACVQTKFPQLNLAQCLKVLKQSIQFYSRQILVDYMTALSQSLETFLKQAEDNEDLSVEDLTLFGYELGKIEDFNERTRDPLILNFEYRSKKYRLRSEQVNDISSLTAIDEETGLYKSTVIQRMMAAGKTLVLGTISVVKKALDGTRLSILVPPSSLYQSNTTAMQNRTYQYFKKKGATFLFPRIALSPSSFTETADEHKKLMHFLRTIKDLMVDTIKTRNYMILSPDTLHSFLNSYIEVIMTIEPNSGNPGYEKVLKAYSEIYRLLKTRGSIILDEVDMTMDPRKELNFPTTEVEPYNMIAVSLITDIVEFLVFDENVIESGLLIHSNNQASLTPEAFITCRGLIIEYISKEIKDGGSIWNRRLLNNVIQKEETINNIIQFLSNPSMTALKDWILDFRKSGNEIVADALLILKTQLYQYMQESFQGTVNENFGSAGSLRPEIKYAVPFLAANTPSPASVFADRWETLLKTLLMVAASPCPDHLAKDIIKYCRQAMAIESIGKNSVKETATYSNLALILPNNFGPSTLDYSKPEHLEIILKGLRPRTPAAIRILFGYYIEHIFGKMDFHTEQITSNALNMASMVGSNQGYSGTIDNVNILPQVVIQDAYKDHIDNEKNNGGIALKMVRDCDDSTVPELENKTFLKSCLEMVKDVFALYPDKAEKVSAIIDTGAFFKNFKNRQVAEAVLIHFDGALEAALYYDEDSNQLEYVRISGKGQGAVFTRGFLETTDPDDILRATQATIDKRFTFYDQRHITGSDILQPKSAFALMTAGPRVLLRDLLQGTLRMRQFMTSQKVYLITTAATKLFYVSKCSHKGHLYFDLGNQMKVSDILTLGAFNEDDKQNHENEKLAYVKIDAEIRSYVLDEISFYFESNMDGFKFKLGSQLFKSTRSLFIRSIRESPPNWLHELTFEEPESILKKYAIARLMAFNPIIKNISSNSLQARLFKDRFNALKRKIRSMVDASRKDETDSLLYYLKGRKICTKLGKENGTEVQMLTQTLLDVNIDVQIDQYNGIAVSHFSKMNILEDVMEYSESPILDSIHESYVNLYDLYNDPNTNQIHRPYLKKVLATSGKRVGVSLQLIKLISLSRVEPYPIFTKYNAEGSHILVQLTHPDTPKLAQIKVVLVSTKQASLIRREMPQYRSNRDLLWLCDLSGTIHFSSGLGATPGKHILDSLPAARNLIFDALIFNASLPQILNNVHYKEVYEQWISDADFKEKATFLKKRFLALQDKDKYMFEETDAEIRRLTQYAKGERNIGDDAFAGNGGYIKDKISREFEQLKIDQLSISKAAISSGLESSQFTPTAFDITAELLKIFPIKKNDLKPPVNINYYQNELSPAQDQDGCPNPDAPGEGFESVPIEGILLNEEDQIKIACANELKVENSLELEGIAELESEIEVEPRLSKPTKKLKAIKDERIADKRLAGLEKEDTSVEEIKIDEEFIDPAVSIASNVDLGPKFVPSAKFEPLEPKNDDESAAVADDADEDEDDSNAVAAGSEFNLKFGSDPSDPKTKSGGGGDDGAGEIIYNDGSDDDDDGNGGKFTSNTVGGPSNGASNEDPKNGPNSNPSKAKKEPTQPPIPPTNSVKDPASNAASPTATDASNAKGSASCLWPLIIACATVLVAAIAGVVSLKVFRITSEAQNEDL